LTIAGPSFRLTLERMQTLGPDLVSYASQLATTSGASPFFNQAQREHNGTQGITRKPIYAE